MTLPNDLTFLAPPGEAADWRMVLLCEAAATTGVLDKLPGTADELATRTGLDPEALRVVLDALVSLGVLDAGADGIFAAGPAGPEAGEIPRLRHHARAVRRWAAGIEPRLRGQPTRDPDFVADETFHDALAANATKVAPEIVDVCLRRFPNSRSMLDLGGLHGEYAMEFTRRGLQATMQDKPEVIEIVQRRGRLSAAGVKLFAGSFFEAVPAGPFDLAFCSGITHTFGAAENLALFRHLRRVVAPGGGVAVVTFLRGRHPTTALFAVQMLLNDNGGDTHTEEEYRTWLREAGFAVDDAVLDLPGQGARSVLFAT